MTIDLHQLVLTLLLGLLGAAVVGWGVEILKRTFKAIFRRD